VPPSAELEARLSLPPTAIISGASMSLAIIQ
jgi:hypothetical protein